MVDWVKVGIAAGFGAADKYAADLDASAVPARATPFRTYSDYLRIVGAVGGLGIQMLTPRYAKAAEAIALPAVAFLTQSVWAYAKGTTRQVTYTPVRTGAGTGAGRRVAMNEPQFQGVELH